MYIYGPLGVLECCAVCAERPARVRLSKITHSRALINTYRVEWSHLLSSETLEYCTVYSTQCTKTSLLYVVCRHRTVIAGWGRCQRCCQLCPGSARRPRTRAPAASRRLSQMLTKSCSSPQNDELKSFSSILINFDKIIVN